MSQIEITVLKQGLKSRNVLSCSFFKMTNAYRDFSKYESNLKRFLSQSLALKGFEVRIYTDDTAKDICLQLANQRDHVSVYHYNCEIFRDGAGHKGTFGTVVRLLPLFEKDLDLVWISDIDVPDSYLNPKIPSTMKQNKCSIFVHTMVCYNRKPWGSVKYPILAGSFLSAVSFPKQLLTRYLNKVHTGGYADMIEAINVFNNRKSADTVFPYGMDEVFMNGPIYNSIKRHSVNVMVYKDYFSQNFIVYSVEGFPKKDIVLLEQYYKHPTPELFRKAKDVYKTYVPMITEKYPCMKEFLDDEPHLKNSFIRVLVVPSVMI